MFNFLNKYGEILGIVYDKYIYPYLLSIKKWNNNDGSSRWRNLGRKDKQSVEEFRNEWKIKFYVYAYNNTHQ